MKDLDDLVKENFKAYANAFVDEIGYAFEKEIEKSFIEKDNNGNSIQSHYIEQIEFLIQNMDEDSVEHHLNLMKPKYTAKMKEPKHGGKNKTRKRKQQGGTDIFSRAVSNFLEEPKLRIKNAIENNLLDHVFTEVIENVFYTATFGFSLDEDLEKDLEEKRDEIVKKMFDKYGYAQVKDAILKERCNPNNRSKSRNKCNS